MNILQKKIGHEQVITDGKGEVEYIIIPVQEYNKILELLEDYGLGNAMKEAEGSPVMNRKDALRLLKNA